MVRQSRFILKMLVTVTALLFLSFASAKGIVGIYISQHNAQSTKKMNYFIKQAKRYGINTFIIDTKKRSSIYAKNVRKVCRAGIKFVSRVVIFPGGGNRSQVMNKNIWRKKLGLAKYAVSLCASEIQMDYIRYSIKTGSSKKKAYHIKDIIKYFRNNLPSSVKLQIDIFGVAAHRPSNTIGQNVKLFAPYLNVICPMVYPSHYEPFKYHATRPYNTVLKSVSALKRQLRGNGNHVRVIAWIELYNYRYPMSRAKRASYTRAQIQAAHDAGARGYYVWSAQNKYGVLFNVLGR